jgi:hypothetical protein
MDRNLGALSNGSLGTSADVLKSYGLMYVWGRKDPFPGPDAISPSPNATDMASNWGFPANQQTGNQIFYYARYGEQTEVKIPTTSGGLPTTTPPNLSVIDNIKFTIRNPEVYLVAATLPYWWFTSKTFKSFSDQAEEGYYADDDDLEKAWGHLWGNMTVSGSNNSAVGVKTIYDPCPPGWKMPAAHHYRFIAANGADLSANAVKRTPWAMNSVEARKAYEAGYITREPDVLWYSTFKRGFNFYIQDRNTGTNAGDAPDQGEYTKVASGKTMFLPAAGTRLWSSSAAIRTGASCHYLNNQVRGLKANGTGQGTCSGSFSEISVSGVSRWSIASDYDQPAGARSARCIKE